ncbi:MAG: hypothetical protein ACFFD4_03585 [Candidatus Odinarchaeota archaeon]
MAENGKGPLKVKTFYSNESIGISIARWPYRVIDGKGRPGKISFQIISIEEVETQKKVNYSKTVFFTPNDARRMADWLSHWAYEQDLENDTHYRDAKKDKQSMKSSKQQEADHSYSLKELEEILFALFRGETTIVSKIRSALEEKNIDIPVQQLVDLLEKLKVEGKVSSVEKTAKQGHKYTVWTFSN